MTQKKELTTSTYISEEFEKSFVRENLKPIVLTYSL